MVMKTFEYENKSYVIDNILDVINPAKCVLTVSATVVNPAVRAVQNPASTLTKN